MQIQFFSKNIDLDDNQKGYISEKINNLTKYEQRIDDEATLIRVDVTRRKDTSGDFKISFQVTMFIPKATIRAEVYGSTVEESIDLAVEKLKKQIERYKTKKHKREAGGKLMPDSTLEMAKNEQMEQFDFEKIVKRKKYDKLEPMQEYEAIDQMELLGHDFYAFINLDTDLFSVLYRRQDGDYGLIELGKNQ